MLCAAEQHRLWICPGCQRYGYTCFDATVSTIGDLDFDSGPDIVAAVGSTLRLYHNSSGTGTLRLSSPSSRNQ